MCKNNCQQLSAISVVGFVFSDLTTPCSSVFSHPSVMSLSLSASPCWAVIYQSALWKLLLSLLMAQLRQQGPALFQVIISTVKLFTHLYKRKDRNASSPRNCERNLREPMASCCQPFQRKKEQDEIWCTLTRRGVYTLIWCLKSDATF